MWRTVGAAERGELVVAQLAVGRREGGGVGQREGGGELHRAAQVVARAGLVRGWGQGRGRGRGRVGVRVRGWGRD